MKSSTSSGSKFNFVRRVLSRTSSRNRSESRDSKSSTKNTKTDNSHMENSLEEIPQIQQIQPPTPRASAKFQSELLLLKSQIESLQISVHHVQSENATKEKALAAATREKEQLSVDLKKQKRSNANLRQQLEDERSFYYKEKEQYCQEMNNFKKRKQKDKQNSDNKSNYSEQKEVSELKNTLNQTLEANYNLSVKFLRMKNTKLALKKQLNALANQHDESSKYCKSKVEELRHHMDSLVNEQFYKPIPPSSKKYLHLLRNNGALIHENLQFQMEVDRLQAQIEKLKFTNIRNETNSKLKLIHHDINNKHSSKSSTNSEKSKNTSICTKCKLVFEKLQSNQNKTSRSSQTAPTTSPKSTKPKRNHHHHHKLKENNSKETNSSLNASDLSVEVVKIEKHGKLSCTPTDHGSGSFSEDLKKKEQRQMKYDLMTISNSNIDVRNKGGRVDEFVELELSNSSLESRNAKGSNASQDSEIILEGEVKSAPEILLSGRLKKV